MGGGPQRIFILVVVMLTELAQAVPAISTSFRRYDITQQAFQHFAGDIGSVRVLGNKILKLSQASRPGARIVFEDRKPGANWTHPAALLVLDQAGRVIEEIATNRPPVFLRNDLTLEGILNQEPVRFQVSSFDGKYRIAEPEKHYALLFNGQADLRHWNDFSFLYRVLREVYGYKKENIFVADSNFKNTQSDLDGDGTADIAFASDRAGLEAVIAQIKTRLHTNDQLLLVMNDHGARQGGESTLILQDGEIKASEFAKLFEGLATQRILSIFEQCYSGGFVRPMTAHAGNARVSMSAAMDIELSWASDDLNFNEFLYRVIAAFAFQTHDGKPLSADADSDGKVSAQEAFAFATSRDQSPENPLMESAANFGLARNIGFGF